MTDFEKIYAGRTSDRPSRVAFPVTQAIGTAVLLALLLAYAVSFVMLLPLAQARMTQSAAEGADPSSSEFVSP